MMTQNDKTYGFDMDGRYDGTEKYYWAFDEFLMDKLRAAGVLWVLEKLRTSPIRPRAAYDAVRRRNESEADRKEIRNYQGDLDRYLPAVDRAYHVVVGSLGPVPLASVRVILEDENVDSRRKVKRVLAYLRATDGAVTESKKAEIENDMEDLPYGVDAASAMQLMSGLTHLNAILRKLGNSQHSDAALRSRLLKKLRGPMFKVVKYDVDTNGVELTYAEVCHKIRKAISVEELENGEIRMSGHKRRAADELMTSASLHAVDGNSISGSRGDYLHAVFAPTSIASQQQWGTQQVSMIQAPSSPVVQNITSARDQNSCWNCNGLGHVARNCPSLTCGRCGTQFPNYDVVGFHNSASCPSKAVSRSSIQKTPFARAGGEGGRGRRGGRGGGRGRGGRGYSGRGLPTVNVANAEINEWDEDVESYGGQNNFVGMTISTGSVSDEVVSRVLLDSGANINACNRKLAGLLNVPIQRWKVPFRVLFGNNTEVWSQEFIDLGGLMGRTAIIENCTYTILSVPRANRKGYSVDMRGGTMRCVVSDRQGKVVVDAPIDASSGLYFIDVGYFMRDHHHQEGAVNVTAGSRRSPMSNKLKIAVKELHECLHHAASPAVMARALRFGAWPNVEMLPTDVERVFSHQNCLACVLGKTNRLPHAFSAETPEYEFGEAVSLDFKVVNPVSVSGHMGFYLFMSGAQGYCLLS
jgi:hypothetical protein